MTHEEILQKNVGSHAHITGNTGILSAMEEYAKQEAIAFAQWIEENGYTRGCFVTWGDGGDLQINGRLTSEQLYTLYQKQLHER